MSRWPLMPLAWLYGAAVRCRNAYYDRAGGVRRPGIPIISVGNVTTGGTGKTPLVIEIARRLCEMARRPAILTRGYGAAEGATADEVLEFAAVLPGVPVVVNPDRVAGAETALREHAADCAVLDDGFQHRRIVRDLNIVVIDCLNPFGGGRLLPAGRLREPLSGLRRADLIVLSRCNQVDAATIDAIRATLERHAPATPLVRAAVTPQGLAIAGESGDTPALAGKIVLPVCGIGNPDTFVRLLEATTGRGVLAPLLFRDHHRYDRADAERISSEAGRLGADLVVTTRKDWVKLDSIWRELQPPTCPLARLDVRMTFADEDGVLDAALRRAVAQ